MARKVRTTKTPEERRAEAEALHETIAAEVEKLRDSTNCVLHGRRATIPRVSEPAFHG